MSRCRTRKPPSHWRIPCDAAAKAAGAANLLLFHDDGRIEARNTDTVGLTESLREAMGRLDGRTVVLLGAGGAARGAVLALDGLGAAKVHILNRHADKAAMLAQALQPMVKSRLAPRRLLQIGAPSPAPPICWSTPPAPA